MGSRVGTAKSDDWQIDLRLNRPVAKRGKGIAPEYRIAYSIHFSFCVSSSEALVSSRATLFVKAAFPLGDIDQIIVGAVSMSLSISCSGCYSAVSAAFKGAVSSMTPMKRDLVTSFVPDYACGSVKPVMVTINAQEPIHQVVSVSSCK